MDRMLWDKAGMRTIPNIPSRPPAAVALLNKKNVHLPSSQSPNQTRSPSTFHPPLTAPKNQSSILSLERFYTQSNKYETSSFHGQLIRIFREWGMQNLSDGLRSTVPIRRIFATNYGSWEGCYELTRSPCSCSVDISRTLMLLISRYICMENVEYKEAMPLCMRMDTCGLA
jgi:hypothetical protein